MECLRLHVKVLTDPAQFSVSHMIDKMNDAYAAANIMVELASMQQLDLPELNDLDVGGCFMGEVTDEQAELFAHDDSVQPGDVVVYFVRSTVPPFNGCAAHPDGQPGAVVTEFASQWTLGHELAHVLGLGHVNDNTRLMTGNGTAGITVDPARLVQFEQDAMNANPLTNPC